MEDTTKEEVITRHRVTKLKPRCSLMGSLAFEGVGVDVSKHTGVVTVALDLAELGEMEHGFSKRRYISTGFSFGQETVKFKSGSVNLTVRLV